MVIYFTLYSFLGFFIQSIFFSIKDKKLRICGFLYGPYIPTWGFAAVLLLFIQPIFLASPICGIILGALFLTSLQYYTYNFVDKNFHIKLWDYSNHKYNINGKTDLRCIVFFLFVSYFFLTFIHPAVSSVFLDNDINTILALLFLTIMLKDYFIHLQKQENKKRLDLH